MAAAAKKCVVKRASSAFFQVGEDGVCRYPRVGNVILVTAATAVLLEAGGWVERAGPDAEPTVLSTRKPAATKATEPAEPAEPAASADEPEAEVTK